jgi:hypothetical protein
MKRCSNKNGSIIIACLLVALVTAVVCISYSVLVMQEYKMSLRSLKANAALNLAEAAIDIAMNELKAKSVGTGQWAETVDANGKTYYSKTVFSNKALGSGDTGTAVVVVDGMNTSSPVITAQGRISHASDGLPPVVKQVKVTLAGISGGGVAGVYSKETINMNGTNVVFDAYDSSKGAYGAQLAGGGTNVLDEVTVAVLNPGAMVNLNKNIVYGKIAFVGPSSQGAANNYSDRIGWQWDNGNGGALYGKETAVTYRNNGKVTATFQPSHVVPNITTPVIDIPKKPDDSTPGIIAITPPRTNETLNLGQSGATTPTIYTVKVSPNEMNNNNLSLSGKTKINIVGPVILIVDGAVSVSGNEAGFYISNTGGAALTMFVKNNINIAGQGVVNSNWDARTFKLIPTGDSGQNISLGGNGDYRGMFLGPTFNANINGNGAWFGAILANSVSITGNGGFHYDIQCGKSNSGEAGYSIAQWLELTNVPGTTYKRDTRSVFN